jgi:hypothetical protein
MKSLQLISLILFFLSLNGCKSDPAIPSTCDSMLVIDKNGFENGPNDEFDIDTLVLSGNCLELTYFYGGGCGTTKMQLFDYDKFIDNTMNLPKRRLRFSFKDDDNCEAYIKTTESFDLTPLQKGNSSPLRIEINGWDAMLQYHF